ncbi:MAG: right-handed parallel beta-helix repeat-containing protein [Deltaproteobacteria bacterium]|nr:right-handed parallel beta-helix repeat-containing protein [Deltaproteobacteria bacterium]
MTRRGGWTVLGCLAASISLAACSSGDFAVAGEPGADGGGEAGLDAGQDGGDDAPLPSDGSTPDTTPAGDVAPVEVGPTCPVVSNPTEIWVDLASTTATSNGTSACPFKQIADAVTFANTLSIAPRTIRVKAGHYNEVVALKLRQGIKLLGAGAATTTLSGGGNCTSSATGFWCIVRVEGGATLDGFTIDAGPTAKHGVVTGETGTAGYPVVRNVKISGAVGDGNTGILSMSGSQLGPNVESTGNRYGLVIWGNQIVKVVNGANRFDDNSIIGINHEGTGQLIFEGGSVSGNPVGIKLGDVTTTTPANNTITSAIVRDNTEVGLLVGAHASAKVRGSAFTGGKVGIAVVYGSTNIVDLGASSSDLGGNDFGNATTRNSKAGLCVGVTRAAALPALGNKWPACSPTVQNLGTVTSCDSVPSYADVWWRGVSAPNVGGCVVSGT